ncbi:MAG: Trk system potassium transporter TrkA [Pseudomonadota bacterium]|nr:Trk system potassium transporter TrkA [Pseudomonadota bacterium]
MKILILGAGQVGCAIAEILANENNDVTVVDDDEKTLAQLREKLDIQVVLGKASHPNVLRKAGAKDTDMLIAVTSSDETNMIACQIAYTLFKTPKKIARLRSSSYMTRQTLFGKDHIPIDVIINPEQLVTNQIKRLVQYPGATQVLDFADGKVELVATKAEFGAEMIGHELRDLVKFNPNLESRVAAIFRNNQPIIPEGTTVVEQGDEVFFIAAKDQIKNVIEELQPQHSSKYRNIMIAGGGNIGERLAEALETRHNVKIIELNADRTVHLANHLSKALVLRGSASDETLLVEENISSIDLFIAVTNDDEANIMSCLLAKKLGADKVISLINNPSYADLVQGGKIDIAISPKLATISSLLAHIRHGDISRVYSLRRGSAEAIEIIAHGDQKTSKVVGRQINQIDLPKSASIGAIVRGDELLIAHHDTVIESDDHVIVFIADKSDVKAIEELFHVAFTFF